MKTEKLKVYSPYSGQVVDEIPVCSIDEIPEIIHRAQKGFALVRSMPVSQRAEILRKAANALLVQKEEFAAMLAKEVGKVITDARKEVERAANTIRLSAEAVFQVCGEVIPMESDADGIRVGYYKRVPVGIVLAITPFNFPLNLACHKIGPAVAAGNAVIIKPASKTPLTTYMLKKLLVECGLPEEAITVVCGEGESFGNALVQQEAIRKISFTGSYAAGNAICKSAGVKKVTMELGSTGAVVVTEHTDLEKAAKKISAAGFANAGQVCISVQRVYAHEAVKETLIAAVKKYAEAIVYGDPLDERTQLGPMISEKAQKNALDKIEKSVEMGAVVVTGNKTEGTILIPTVLRDAPEDSPVIKTELFAPVIVINGYQDFADAIHKVNDTDFGLQAGIFTDSIDEAMRFAEEIDCGGIIINDTCNFRVDQMPYGGMKHSGLGKEGPGFAIKEMTELKMVVMNNKI